MYNLDYKAEELNNGEYNIKEDYISFGGSIPVNHMTYETFCQKIQTITDAYNKENDIQVICYTANYNDGKARCEVYSYNYPVSRIGDEARIKLGPTFYETSKQFGSGRSDSTFHIENYGFAQHPYIPEGNWIIVNGVSYLTKEGKILSSEYYTYDEIKQQHISNPINTDKEHMLHICTEERDLGWVLPATLDAIPKE